MQLFLTKLSDSTRLNPTNGEEVAKQQIHEKMGMKKVARQFFSLSPPL
jgi:hypothetical protein